MFDKILLKNKEILIGLYEINANACKSILQINSFSRYLLLKCIASIVTRSFTFKYCFALRQMQFIFTANYTKYYIRSENSYVVIALP